MVLAQASQCSAPSTTRSMSITGTTPCAPIYWNTPDEQLRRLTSTTLRCSTSRTSASEITSNFVALPCDRERRISEPPPRDEVNLTPSSRCRGVNLVMVGGSLAIDQETVVLRIEHCDLDILSGEPSDRVQGFPEAERDELGSIAVRSREYVCAKIPRRCLVLPYAGLEQVGNVRSLIIDGRPASPRSGDHRLSLRLSDDELPLQTGAASWCRKKATYGLSRDAIKAPFDRRRGANLASVEDAG